MGSIEVTIVGDQRVKRTRNGNIVKLLVGLPGGALAVVFVLGGHPQQLIFGLIGVFLSGVQLCFHGFQLAGLLVKEAVLLFAVGLFGLLRFGGSGLLLFRRGGLLGLRRGLLLGGSLGRLLGFFAHSRSSL